MKLIKYKWYYINPDFEILFKWNTTRGCKKLRSILKNLKKRKCTQKNKCFSLSTFMNL